MTPQRFARLLEGPVHPEQDFVAGGATFQEVYAMAADLRDRLQAAEQGPAPVCLVSEDRALLASALLAGLAGGPTLLLPYALSAPALERSRQLSGFTLAISDQPPLFPPGTTCLQPGPGREMRLSGPGKRPEDELLCLFTGGTTGMPQLWRKSVRNLFGESCFLADHFSIGTNDLLLATVPPYHIYGLLFSVLLPLVSGATVMGPSPAYPEEILQAIESDGASVLISIPPHYRALKGKPLPDHRLRLAFSSAGMLEERDSTGFTAGSGIGVVEVYGSTETGGLAHRNRALGQDHFTAFPTVQWRSRDEQLWVQTPFLSPGLPLDQEGFFCTGDRIQALDDHGFALRGRGDAITKVGGKRVDLNEVQAAICQLTGVEDCRVLALPDPGGREHRLAALVETKSLRSDQIRQALHGRLEAYALPRIIQTVERMPLTDSGKIDRARLLTLLTP